MNTKDKQENLPTENPATQSRSPLLPTWTAVVGTLATAPSTEPKSNHKSASNSPGDENQEDKSEDANDEPMASDEDAEKAKSKSATSRQNEQLYAVEGEFFDDDMFMIY
ncbi:putative GTP-binding protein-plant [Corchorus olitorius]|uniref:GTP-binding protein-plant n=2 Tax=Corchorus olitorius TaxID=93759 RepID=A0A1R3IKI7_9ROSI|nr:putative GTP-binding protein-plant [Corchorus olitorius]